MRVSLLSRIIKPFVSILQRIPSILKEFFMLGRIMKIFFFSIPQRRFSIFKEFFAWYNNKNIYLFNSAKKTQEI